MGGTSPDAGADPAEGAVSMVVADAMVVCVADADGDADADADADDGCACTDTGETGTCEGGGRVIT